MQSLWVKYASRTDKSSADADAAADLHTDIDGYTIARLH